MARKAKVVLTAEAVKRVIDERKPGSMTQLAHGLGYRGSVSSSLTRKFRTLFPDIDVLLKRTAESAKGNGGEGKAEKPAAPAEAKAGKKATANGKPRPVAAKGGKWKRDARNPFREASAYGTCFDILAAHPDGLPRSELVQLLAKATGKDAKHAAYDAQVVLSAGPNEAGLSNNDSPRHRSCRAGFWIKRANGRVTLMVD